MSYYIIYIFVSLCGGGGELWVDQRKMCTDIRDVAQVTMSACSHFPIDVICSVSG